MVSLDANVLVPSAKKPAKISDVVGKLKILVK